VRRPSEWYTTGGIVVAAVTVAVLLLWGLACGLLTITP